VKSADKNKRDLYVNKVDVIEAATRCIDMACLSLQHAVKSWFAQPR